MAIAAPAQPITVALNLSVRQLHEPGIVGAVQQVLTETSLDPAALVLEVTEGTLTEDLDVGRTLQRLRDSGVAIAIDDFGTGYSSLARLRDLPVDQVKLDKSFLADLDDDGAATVAAAAVALAHGLGLSVVAEGVETEQQLEFVRRHDCDFTQGFLLHRPGSAAAVDHLLSVENAWLPGPRDGVRDSLQVAPSAPPALMASRRDADGGRTAQQHH